MSFSEHGASMSVFVHRWIVEKEKQGGHAARINDYISSPDMERSENKVPKRRKESIQRQPRRVDNY